MAKINLNSLGLSFAALWSVSVFAIAWLSNRNERLKKVVDLISAVYLGYNSSAKGAWVGAIWGFIDGYITGVIIGWSSIHL